MDTETLPIPYWDHALTKWARANATALTAASAFCLVTIKLLAVARFDPAVASALVGSANGASVVLGAAVLVAPFGIAALAGITTVVALYLRAAQRPAQALVTLAVAAWLMAAVAGPISLVFGLLLGMGPSIVRVAFGRTPEVGPTPTPGVSRLLRFQSGVMNLAAVLLVGYTLVQPVPWVPAERITTTTGHVLVGYVVSSNEGWFLVLTDGDRNLQYVSVASVQDRSVCRAKGTFTFPTLWQLIMPAKTPNC